MNTDASPSYPLAELAVLADLPPRTVRYYVQIGLVDRPEGETRAARYGARHLEQLLQIRNGPLPASRSSASASCSTVRRRRCRLANAPSAACRCAAI